MDGAAPSGHVDSGRRPAFHRHAEPSGDAQRLSRPAGGTRACHGNAKSWACRRCCASLLILAVDLPSEYDPRRRAGRIMSLLIDEIRLAPALPLSLPFPGDVRLAARCRRFIERPTAQDTVDLWSRALGLSRRTFTRLFRQETGLTFSAWQRRACLLSAVPRLLGGDAVTTIAFDLDYSSPAAFTTMFKKLVGTSPHAYRRAAS